MDCRSSRNSEFLFPAYLSRDTLVTQFQRQGPPKYGSAPPWQMTCRCPASLHWVRANPTKSIRPPAIEFWTSPTPGYLPTDTSVMPFQNAKAMLSVPPPWQMAPWCLCEPSLGARKSNQGRKAPAAKTKSSHSTDANLHIVVSLSGA